MVPADRAAAVASEVSALLARTTLAGSPVLEVSGATGAGVPAVLAALIALRDRVATRAATRPAGPLRLAIDRAFGVKGRGAVVTGSLRGGSIAEGELAALVDRLSTRLGRGRVRRLVARDTHCPEQAVLSLPAVEPGRGAAWPVPEPGEPPLRPIHLFDPPQRIEVMAEVPDGPPMRFGWRREQHEVVRHEGPERIGALWWRRADNGGLTRDYYRVEDRQGRRFWIFRHGLYGGELAHPDWYLHGLFA